MVAQSSDLSFLLGGMGDKEAASLRSRCGGAHVDALLTLAARGMARGEVVELRCEQEFCGGSGGLLVEVKLIKLTKASGTPRRPNSHTFKPPQTSSLPPLHHLQTPLPSPFSPTTGQMLHHPHLPCLPSCHSHYPLPTHPLLQSSNWRGGLISHIAWQILECPGTQGQVKVRRSVLTERARMGGR